MKLLCISASAADAKEDQEEEENSTNRHKQQQANSEQLNATNNHHHHQQPTKLRSWYDSLRRGLKGGRRSREQRVTISDPISSVQLTQSELIQINGVIEVKPADQQASNGAEKSADSQQISSTTATSEADKQEDTVDHGGNSSSAVPSFSVDPQDKEDDDASEEEEEEASEETCQTLVSYPWFWGGISRRDAEALLRGRKDGTFLVRDSSDRPRYLYSLSFRSNGKTMHTRIEQSAGRLYFSSSSSEATPTRNGAAHKSKREDGSGSLGGLIAVAMNQNNGTDSIFFYSRAGQLRTAAAEDNLEPPAVSTASLHTVQLNTPLSRFAYLLDFEYSSSAADADADQKKALQYLCKFVLHHVPQARAAIEESGDHNGGTQLATLPVELQRFATSSEYFPRPVKVA